jgi:adenylate kinase
MSHTVEISNEGTIRLPSDVLERMKPHTRFVVEVDNHIVVLRPEDEQQPFWATATREEWVKDFRQWVASHKGGPGLSDEAVRRESMYD